MISKCSDELICPDFTSTAEFLYDRIIYKNNT